MEPSQRYETTTHLLQRAAEGDERAIEQICERYLPRMQRWAHGRVPQSVRPFLDTQDVVQETILRTVRHLGNLRAREGLAFQAYVRNALDNRIRDLVRRAGRLPETTDADGAMIEDSAPTPLETLVGQEALASYSSALEHLEASDRELVIARVEMCRRAA